MHTQHLPKTKDIYSGLDRIPTGKASERLTEGCLVLEGGAFRGLYTQGFLDAMMLRDLNLSCVIGVSAGALGGINYVSGQIGRSARTNLTYRHDSRFVGGKALLHSGSILDVGFLTEDRGIHEPLDEERFFRPEQRFVAVATECRSARPTYFEKGKCKDIFLAIRASASLPYLTPMVMIEGRPYLDGACSCPIPYQWAIDEGYTKIIVLRTREARFRKQPSNMKTAAHLYREYPAFAEKLANGDRLYNAQCAELEKLHKEGRLLQISPSQKVTVSRIEKDMEKLGDLYWLGYQDCLDKWEELQEYLFS